MHVLREGIPTHIPRIPDYAPRQRIRADRARAEAAFDRLFRPVRRSRSDVVIAHGNLIRFFACRALEVEPVTWVKLGSTHCSITEIVIEANGYMRLRSFNESHHLPRKLRTLSLAVSKQD
jgi:serine/threonine-protein phosphatase PGAM5